MKKFSWLLGAGLILTWGFALGIYGRVVMGRSESYKEAIAFIGASEIVREECGQPQEITRPFLNSGKEKTVGDRGTAMLQFDIVGTKARGRIAVHLQRSAGVWRVLHAELRLDGVKQTIILTPTTEAHSFPASY